MRGFLIFAWQLCKLQYITITWKSLQTFNYPTVCNHRKISLFSLESSKYHSDDRVLDWPEMMNRHWMQGGISEELKRLNESFMRIQPTAALLNLHYMFIVSIQNPLCKQTPVYLKLSVKTQSNHQPRVDHTPDKHSQFAQWVICATLAKVSFFFF